ncbi:hypothetical protein GCM10023086_68200 [Streptomyces venetus]|uniref:Uncharacterized protein n=1 Tax=Streptomyces venetus TaxID=1701086 RepID=A0ABP8H7V2_9ACTN
MLCQWPATLGLDVVGTVDTVGERVRHVSVGRRVAHLGDVRARGRFAECTLADATTLAAVPDAPASGAAYTLGDERARARLAAMLTDLLAMTAQGRLDAMPTRTVALDDVPEALIELSGRRVRGKIVYVRD